MEIKKETLVSVCLSSQDIAALVAAKEVFTEMVKDCSAEEVLVDKDGERLCYIEDIKKMAGRLDMLSKQLNTKEDISN